MGLYNKPGRGRKPIFNEEQEKQIKQWVNESPKNLKKVLILVEKEWETNASKQTIKRILKKNNYRWKRMKRGLARKPVSWEYDVKIERRLGAKRTRQKRTN